jgi:hypothetical protein
MAVQAAAAVVVQAVAAVAVAVFPAGRMAVAMAQITSAIFHRNIPAQNWKKCFMHGIMLTHI